MSKLVLPEFDSLRVSTKTFTATTNLNINIEKLFEKIPITEYKVVPKKRGRKKKNIIDDPNKNIKYGSIITAKYENKIRGVEIKKKKKTNRKKWFRNSVTIIIVLDKHINFKVCKNGTFQITGCKIDEHAYICIEYIWKYMKEMNDDIFSFTRGDNLEVLIIPSMRNIDFSLGFVIDREELNNYMYENIDLHCLLETSFGYTGVNIKIPIDKDIKKMKIKKIVYEGDLVTKYDTTYNEYLNLLCDKDRKQKLKTIRYNTFLVFHSGKVIMSGLTAEYMRDVYYYFTSIIQNARDKIEENILSF